MTIDEARKLTDQQLVEVSERFTKLLNKSHDSWHRRCLNEALEAIEEVASERGIEI